MPQLGGTRHIGELGKHKHSLFCLYHAVLLAGQGEERQVCNLAVAG
jgi:hypothetical protein